MLKSLVIRVIVAQLLKKNHQVFCDLGDFVIEILKTDFGSSKFCIEKCDRWCGIFKDFF